MSPKDLLTFLILRHNIPEPTDKSEASLDIYIASKSAHRFQFAQKLGGKPFLWFFFEAWIINWTTFYTCLCLHLEILNFLRELYTLLKGENVILVLLIFILLELCLLQKSVKFWPENMHNDGFWSAGNCATIYVACVSPCDCLDKS